MADEMGHLPRGPGRILKATVTPANHVPGGMDLSINLLASAVMNDLFKTPQHRIAAMPRLESLGIE